MSGPDASRWRALCLGGFAIFGILCLSVSALGVLPAEVALRDAALSGRSPALTELAAWMTHAGTWRVLIPATACLLACSREWRRRWWLCCGIVLLAALFEHGVKLLVARPRPNFGALGFPSGHSTAVAAFCWLVIYVAGIEHATRARRVTIQSVAALAMLLVGGARILLRAHWPADVVGGLALGSAFAAAGAWWDATRSVTERAPASERKLPGREIGAKRTARIQARAWLVSACVLAQSACSQPTPLPDKPLIVASFYPLYEFTRQVAGDRAEVVSLVPPGVEPHDWEPSPRDVARVRKARLVVHNGAGMDPWAESLLKEAPGEGPLAVNATEGIALLAADLPGHGHDDRARRERGKAPLDPHVWLDPVLARSMVQTIGEALARSDTGNAEAYRQNARAFQSQLQTLHEAYEGGLGQCARRDLVVSHAAFGYLAKRYGLTVVPVMGLAPESEPTPAQIAAVVRFARQRKVKYIFFETLVSPRLAETLAREVGAQTLLFNPIEGLTPQEQAAGKGYVSLMEDNLKALRTALECR